MKKKSRTYPIISRRFLHLYIALIIVLVLFPTSGIVALDTHDIAGLRGDYFAHLLAFLPWAFFMPVVRKSLAQWVLWGLVFANLSEAVHFVVPYRAFNYYDMIANSISIILGFLLFLSTKRWVLKYLVKPQDKITLNAEH